MTHETQYSHIDQLMEMLIAEGPDVMAEVFRKLMNMAMLVERETYLGATHYQRADERIAYANGYKPKRMDTPAGTVTLNVPKSRSRAGEDVDSFFPQCLEQGRRSTRAVMATIAQMYVQGVSTRDVKKVMAELGIENISSSQVSRANAMLDAELSAWRSRSLGVSRYLVVDARYEKVRTEGVVVDVAVLTAVGIGEDGRRHILGTSIALSEAEVHWRDFLDSLVGRGLRGVQFIASDDHSGLRAARQAVFPSVPWQRCQFHLGQNAIHHCASLAIRQRIGSELRQIWNAPDRIEAEKRLAQLVIRYRDKNDGNAPALASWLEANIPDGFNVFSLPEIHRRKCRTTNGIERPVQQEIKRRTRTIRVFPSTASLLRLVSAILVEIDEEWSSDPKRYILWEDTKPA